MMMTSAQCHVPVHVRVIDIALVSARRLEVRVATLRTPARRTVTARESVHTGRLKLYRDATKRNYKDLRFIDIHDIVSL